MIALTICNVVSHASYIPQYYRRTLCRKDDGEESDDEEGAKEEHDGLVVSGTGRLKERSGCDEEK